MRLDSLAVLALATVGCSTNTGGGFPWVLKQKATAHAATNVRTIGPANYNRITSRVLARRVTRPTLANLDFAAYSANMVIRQQQAGDPVRPGEATVPEPHASLFGGQVDATTLSASFAHTPLQKRKLHGPFAFAPLVDYLTRWSVDQATGLEAARAAVRGESWGLPRRPGTHFQEITTAWIDETAGALQIWVKIEFEPWARLFNDMPDEDGDGYPEIYGRLKTGLLSKEVLARIKTDYAGNTLTTAEVHKWANQLASYWYPSYNTDVVKLGGQRRWPLKEAEPDVVASTGGLTVSNPTVVVRGKPQNRAVYNVFVVEGVEPLDGKKAAVRGGGALKNVPVTVELEPVRRAIEAELASHGSWKTWAKEVAPAHRILRRVLKKRPKALKALMGRGGFLFYRRSLDAVAGGDIQKQSPGKNPFAAIVEFKDYLKALGVDFLLVPVPTKADVFPDKLPGLRLPKKNKHPIINPYNRKFLLELNRAGVESVDLLPAYLEARTKRRAGQELYQPQDTHWTDRGLRLAAKMIGERIQRYRWYETLAKRKVEFKLKRTTFTRSGDLVSRLTDREQRRFRPAKLEAHQVLTPKGKLFEDDASSPIVVLGDSFTGVYQRTDCGSAGVSAHVAHQIHHPVDLVMSYGGGPNVRNKLLTRDKKALRKMRLVIWLFAARDFFNYWDDWASLKPTAKKTK